MIERRGSGAGATTRALSADKERGASADRALDRDETDAGLDVRGEREIAGACGVGTGAVGAIAADAAVRDDCSAASP
jgi:hypothetical protein